MFFILTKLISLIISPLFLTIVVTIALFVSRSSKWKFRFGIMALAILLLFSNPTVYHSVLGLWDINTTRMEDITGQFDVGIVLGGYLSKPEGTSQIHFGPSGNRLLAAVQLYHQKKIKKILLSGGFYDLDHPENKEAPLIKNFLITSGIPSKDILVDENSRNTYENAIYASQILGEHVPDQKYLLISSNYHLRRAMASFNKAGLNVTPFATEKGFGEGEFRASELIPSAHTFMMWEALLHEMVGYIFYTAKGYI